MCNITDNEEFAQRWDDYFEHVNNEVYQDLKFEDELYQAYGAYNGLRVEWIKGWYRDAESHHINSIDPRSYVRNKYGDHPGLTEDDVDYFLDKEIGDGMIYENNGYWFRA